MTWADRFRYKDAARPDGPDAGRSRSGGKAGLGMVQAAIRGKRVRVAAPSCDQLSLRGDQRSPKGRAGLISACFLMVTHPASAEVSRFVSPPAATAPRGVFSSVRYIEEAGDLLGYELRFFQRDGRSMAEVVACEGWCTSSKIVPVVRRGNAFELSYAEAANSGANHLLRTRLQFRWVGRSLALAAWYDGKPADWLREDRLLTPRTQAYGLAVAHRMEEAERHSAKRMEEPK